MQHFINYRDRKYRATTQKMSITYFKLQDNPKDFRVGVIGSRKIPYILDFSVSKLDVTCTCPDFQNRESKPICKHMLFIISLSNQRSMFNNLTSHIELKNETIISLIRTSLIAVIDKKKLSSELDESNTVSIERDDFCSICMCDLDNKIEKCSVCSHVMHIQCITGWWELSSRWNLNKGKCPYCKDPKGFSHIKYMDEDPWKNFDFSLEASAPEAQSIEVPAPEAQALEAPAPEAQAIEVPAPEAQALEAPAPEAPAQEAPAPEAQALEAPAPEAPAEEAPAEEAPAPEAQAIEVPAPEAQALEAPAPEASNDQILDAFRDQLILENQNEVSNIENHSWINRTMFRQIQILLEHISRMRNLNITNPEIQNLEANLQSLNDEHNMIQNAFQSERE
jgi:hypothetical protein